MAAQPTHSWYYLIVEAVPGPAGAHEAAEGVAAPSLVTELCHGPALVNVLQYDCLLIGLEALAAWADNLVLSRARGGAGITAGSPSLS